MRKRFLLLLAALIVLAGCGKRTEDKTAGEAPAVLSMETLNSALTPVAPEDKFRTTYEVFVYSFADSDGDGIGDLAGLRSKLDYINSGDLADRTSLGCTSLWLMPVFPSPTYHKYDVTDYRAIDPQYGTMEEFRALLEDCHARGMTLILDLAVNHTSVEHPWFAAVSEYLRNHHPQAGEDSLSLWTEEDLEECPYLDYYNFRTEAGNGYAQLPGTEYFYECRFWEGMPDLNLDCGAVREEIRDIARFWLEMGVDGFRLDAVTSYYTESGEDSIRFLTWFNEAVKSIKPDAYLVGEAWENQQVYARYYASGIDSLFDFGFAGQDGIIAGTVKGSRGADSFAAALEDEEALYASAAPDGCTAVNAPFYTNHDMARSAGYYAYDDGSKTKLAEGLNLLMTGNAFLYYGEELGMKGSGRDENKRAPMYWTADPESPDAEYLCAGPPEMEEVKMKFPALDEQAGDELSVWNYCRNAVRIRNSFPSVARGRTEVIESLTDKNVCVFTRDSVLIAVNTREEPAAVSLDADPAAEGYRSLAAMLTTGEEPVELSGAELTLPGYGIAVITKSE